MESQAPSELRLIFFGEIRAEDAKLMPMKSRPA
jgi:hypothetical protein